MKQNVTWPVADTGSNKGGQLRVALAGLLVLGALAYLVFASMPHGTVYYQTVREVRQQPSDPKPVRVAGSVAEGSIQKSIAESRLRFEIVDGVAGTDRLAVAYHGVVPDIFGPNIDVVVEGQRDSSGVFQAQTLLAKCPSRFENAIPTPGGASNP